MEEEVALILFIGKLIISQVRQISLFVEDGVHSFALKFSNFCQEKALDSLKKSTLGPAKFPVFT